ncbi:unnamed protein product [Candidula unifasciata]|uniref:Metallo-beta-lactamase domain-containing protein n=1 Tax=Candidula unifasciata TaxID=100452 RepID=A0A8S3YWV4_9EUPU|nr:unnamed protein product [Candidula unifasciata]
MGNRLGSCVFKCGYTLYADTCIGRCIHDKYIDAFQKEFGENAVHSQLTPFAFNDLLILPIPVLTSNYAYLVADVCDNNFVLIDVGDASLIKNVLFEPDAILTTHKHWDHSGGNKAMRATFPKLKIYGGALDRVPDSTHGVYDGDVLIFGRLKFTAMWTPGHTKGHIVWRLHGDKFGTSDCLFTGDHLMLAGCGAAFEGPVKQLIRSLNLLKVLPNDTLVWPGHEVGLENLQLAAFIEPENACAVVKLVWATTQREAMLCTCPSTLGEEKKYNPFLRTNDESLWKALGIYDNVKKKTLKQDDIGSVCFECIIAKAMDMRRLRHTIEKTNESGEEGTGQQVEAESNVDARKDTTTAPDCCRPIADQATTKETAR